MSGLEHRAEHEREAKAAELERLLNDPSTPLDPHRIWSLLAELATSATVPLGPPQQGPGSPAAFIQRRNNS